MLKFGKNTQTQAKEIAVRFSTSVKCHMAASNRISIHVILTQVFVATLAFPI